MVNWVILFDDSVFYGFYHPASQAVLNSAIPVFLVSLPHPITKSKHHSPLSFHVNGLFAACTFFAARSKKSYARKSRYQKWPTPIKSNISFSNLRFLEVPSRFTRTSCKEKSLTSETPPPWMKEMDRFPTPGRTRRLLRGLFCSLLASRVSYNTISYHSDLKGQSLMLVLARQVIPHSTLTL